MAQGSSQVQAGSIQVVGGYGTRGSATLSPKPVTGMRPVPDPLAGFAAPNGGVKRGFVNLTTGSVTINPGTPEPEILPLWVTDSFSACTTRGR